MNLLYNYNIHIWFTIINEELTRNPVGFNELLVLKYE